MSKKVIYLVRHAEALKLDNSKCINEDTQINNEKIILSVEGEKQAEKLSKSLELKNIDSLWSSNYVRAVSTAKYISKENNIPINIDVNFNERKLGDLNQLLKLGKKRKYSYTIEQLIDENLKNKNGESRKEVTKRFSNSLDKILNGTSKKVVIVSHGAAIKYMLLKWCIVNSDNQIVYNDKVIIDNKLELPNVIKLTFKEQKLIDIQNIKCT